jgi:hypothetical protein
MEHIPNQFEASQEIHCILWNLKFHYHIYKCSPPVPILNQLNQVHTPTSHLLKIHLNIILPSMPRSPQWSLSVRFPHQNPVHASPLPHTPYLPRLSHSSWFYHPDNSGWGVQIIKLIIIYSSPLPSYFNPLRPKYSQYPVLKHPQPMFLRQCQRPSFTPTEVIVTPKYFLLSVPSMWHGQIFTGLLHHLWYAMLEYSSSHFHVQIQILWGLKLIKFWGPSLRK